MLRRSDKIEARRARRRAQARLKHIIERREPIPDYLLFDLDQKPPPGYWRPPLLSMWYPPEMKAGT